MNTEILQVANEPLAGLELTKTNANDLAQRITDTVADGNAYALEMLAKLSFLQEVVKKAIDGIRPLAVTEAEAYGTPTFTVGGVTMQAKETGVKYDYSDSEEWRELKRINDIATLDLKQCEERLKHDGAYVKTATPSVSVTLPR